MKQFTISNEKPPEEMDPSELVDHYCFLDYIKKSLDARIKAIKPEVKKALEKTGVKNASGSSFQIATVNSSLTLENRRRREVDVDFAFQLLKDKKVELGTLVRTITPKGELIPLDALDILDEYFNVHESLEVKAADVDKALAVNVIDKDQYDKLIQSKDSSALKPKLTDMGISQLEE